MTPQRSSKCSSFRFLLFHYQHSLSGVINVLHSNKFWYGHTVQDTGLGKALKEFSRFYFLFLLVLFNKIQFKNKNKNLSTKIFWNMVECRSWTKTHGERTLENATHLSSIPNNKIDKSDTRGWGSSGTNMSPTQSQRYNWALVLWL